MTEYPAEFPTDALSFVVRALRSGDLSDVDCLARSAWNVQGYAMSHLIGPGLHVVGSSGPPMSEAKALDEIDAFLAEHEATDPNVVGASGAGVVGAFPVPWGVLLSLAMGLLQKLLDSKRR